jgi:hypothetical protein
VQVVYFNGAGPAGLKRPGRPQPSSAQPQRVVGAALRSLPSTAHYVLEEDDRFCSVAGTGLLAGVLAVPAGIAVHRYVIPAMAGAAGLGVPSSLQNVYGAGELAALALAGLVIALAGALLPAGWAAQSRTALALRAE